MFEKTDTDMISLKELTKIVIDIWYNYQFQVAKQNKIFNTYLVNERAQLKKTYERISSPSRLEANYNNIVDTEKKFKEASASYKTRNTALKEELDRRFVNLTITDKSLSNESKNLEAK